MRVMVIDCETGGLDHTKHSVFSIGALIGDLNTGEILERFEIFHKMDSVDNYIYSKSAIEIHGITPQQAFTNGLNKIEIQTKIVDLWNKYGIVIIGGHNVDYDIRMLASQIFDLSIPEFEANFSYRKLDTQPLIRLFMGHENALSGASLHQAIKALSIDMTEFGKDKYHTALFDAICSFKIMCKFRRILLESDVIERLTK